MQQTLLAFVYKHMRGHPAYIREMPTSLSLLRKDPSAKLASSTVGVAYALAVEWPLDNYYLQVNRFKVAEGRLEIMLWMLDNAPRTYEAVVRLVMEYEKEHSVVSSNYN